ncbi:MAG: hypothetical protein J6Y02_24955 [Pseudobutyrivibrio sp.]|nr:hypothetical protein [Pseudobutyrivibrio sp.]
MANYELGRALMGKTNHCRWCNFCDDLGNCSKVKRCIGWEMANNIEVSDEGCPKRRRKER